MHHSQIGTDHNIGAVRSEVIDGQRVVTIPAIVGIDGMDLMVPCHKDNPEGQSLKLSEEQTRQLCDRLLGITEAWDEADDTFGK